MGATQLVSISASQLVDACSDDSFHAGIRILTELEPIGGQGAPVKPAVYEGGLYQQDRRWASAGDECPSPVIVIDNVPSQANRLEAAISHNRNATGVPEFVLDLSSIGSLPAHLPTTLSSWQFPHRVADAYLRDSALDGVDFLKTELGKGLVDATPERAGALMAWFPQALLYGFWQSYLGKKRANTKHARAWVSEVVGWNPAATETRTLGLKGDALNLSISEVVTSNPNDREVWTVGTGDVPEGKSASLSAMGHGQIPFMSEPGLAAAAVSFERITQTATVSFAQLRRISIGTTAIADAAARALLVAMGLYGHVHAFGQGFALRSGADLRPASVEATWLGASVDELVKFPTHDEVAKLLTDTLSAAREAGVPLDGWCAEPIVLSPKENLSTAIRASWPLEG